MRHLHVSGTRIYLPPRHQTIWTHHYGRKQHYQQTMRGIVFHVQWLGMWFLQWSELPSTNRLTVDVSLSQQNLAQCGNISQ